MTVLLAQILFFFLGGGGVRLWTVILILINTRSNVIVLHLIGPLLHLPCIYLSEPHLTLRRSSLTMDALLFSLVYYANSSCKNYEAKKLLYFYILLLKIPIQLYGFLPILAERLARILSLYICLYECVHCI